MLKPSFNWVVFTKRPSILKTLITCAFPAMMLIQASPAYAWKVSSVVVLPTFVASPSPCITFKGALEGAAMLVR